HHSAVIPDGTGAVVGRSPVYNAPDPPPIPPPANHRTRSAQRQPDTRRTWCEPTHEPGCGAH
ncbi:hypothetical protein, partial [Micromonospora sp. CP22]|uniref:hypothetical protein n=1 Tax=Micromonospora sp. CP22 TaxID=2580517 RepID=UPI001E56C3A2